MLSTAEMFGTFCQCYCNIIDCTHQDVSPKIREQCKDLLLSDEQLREVMAKLLEAIKKGLGKNTHKDATVKCWTTYVQDLPNGKERGKFLALDLGGTNFRVLVIHLDESHFDMQSKIYAIPEDIMTGSGTKLFDHIAECMANFMSENDMKNERLPLGFTFSFPLEQIGLTKGILKTWTKGFSCSGVVGGDVVKMLEDAIRRRGDIEIEVCGILNDTTGTLMSCAWKNQNCRVGVIVGTGCNACYTEKVENVELYSGDKSKPLMVVNTEWGAFGEKGELDFMLTEFDKEMDQASINPGKQIFEKMISGMYMGELVRLILLKLTKDNILFGGKPSEALLTKWRFKTKYVSEIESEKKGVHTACRTVLQKLSLTHASDQDCINIRYVCECVSRRAAHLVSAGVATLLNRMNIPSVTVGVDGSVYRFHPFFHDLMMEKIAQLVNKNLKCSVMLSQDGSGLGGAIVAATVKCKVQNHRST
ncbi:hexokinase type 2 isoform X2 [Macrosteles quadrilineatus]|uniref:hexokinase type 2 isoform X2 n=1 Tax=Macrosteles quadrilineatus TaxID=74068 RepID=UPI0023E276BA|nr:hexokinase type 2 isoform X2 [Macrosteles quadrilineatus]